MVPTRADLFQLLSGRMTWLARREAVLGQNVANADTPGFRPKDLRAEDFERLVGALGRPGSRLPVRATHPAHLDGQPTANIGLGGVWQETVFETAPDGNAVVLEEQMAKLGETALAYQTTTNLYQKYLAMVRTALGTAR